MTLEEAFQLYAQGIPKDAPEVQRRETKLAFYAGVVSVLTLQLAMAEDDNISEDAVVAILDKWYADSKAFIDKYGKTTH